MHVKRLSGQSSLEFMMTYGWAILVILVAFIVIWQMGLFSLGESVNPGAFGFWGVEPKDFSMHNDGTLKLGLNNNLGANITLLYYNASVGDKFSVCGAGDVPKVITTDKTLIITLNNLLPGQGGKRFEAVVFLKYNDTRTGNYEYVSSGKIWGSYED